MQSSVQEDDPTEIGESARCCSLVPDPLGLALCEFRAGVKHRVVSILRQVQAFGQDSIPVVNKDRFEGRCSRRCRSKSVEIFQGVFHHQRESRHLIHHRFVIGIEGNGAIGALRVEQGNSLRKEHPPSRNRGGWSFRKRVRPRDAPFRTKRNLLQALSILKLQGRWGRTDHPAAWSPTVFTPTCIGNGHGIVQFRDLLNRAANDSHAHPLREIQVSPGRVRPWLPDNLAGAARIHKERKWVRAARCLRNKIGGEKLKGLGGWVGWNPTIAERPCCLAHCLIIVEPANQLEDGAACPWQQRLE